MGFSAFITFIFCGLAAVNLHLGVNDAFAESGTFEPCLNDTQKSAPLSETTIEPIESVFETVENEEIDFSKNEMIKKTIEKGDYAFLNDPELIAGWSKIYDRQNLKRDLNKERNPIESYFPIQEDRKIKIDGTRFYYGLYPKKYRYTAHLSKSNQKITIETKVHIEVTDRYLKKAKEIAIKYPFPVNENINYFQGNQLELKIDSMFFNANQNWNERAPQNLEIKIIRVKDKKSADYSIKLVPGIGALYDQKMGNHELTDPKTFSHEAGHMMGLDDEYSGFFSNVISLHDLLNDQRKDETKKSDFHIAVKDHRCNLLSLMCIGIEIYPYHYKHIVGRIPL